MKHLLLALTVFVIATANSESDKLNMTASKRCPTVLVNNVMCRKCMIALEQVVKYFSKPANVAEFKPIIADQCYKASSDPSCYTVLSEFDSIVKEVMPYLNKSYNFCEKLHFCSNTLSIGSNRIDAMYAQQYKTKCQPPIDLECEECKFIAGEIKSIMADPATEKELREFLEKKMCKHFTKYGPCDDLLDDFMYMVHEILDGLLESPLEYCKNLEFCPKSKSGEQGKAYSM